LIINTIIVLFIINGIKITIIDSQLR